MQRPLTPSIGNSAHKANIFGIGARREFFNKIGETLPFPSHALNGRDALNFGRAASGIDAERPSHLLKAARSFIVDGALCPLMWPHGGATVVPRGCHGD